MPIHIKLKTVEDVIQWVSEHDGRIDAYWEAQHKRNDKVDERFIINEGRLTSVEKRVVWFSGFAAAVGSVIGALITAFLSRGAM